VNEARVLGTMGTLYLEDAARAGESVFAEAVDRCRGRRRDAAARFFLGKLGWTLQS